MRILVTGHKGYIGTVLVPMALAAGHEVIGLDSDLYHRSTFGEGIVDVPEIRKDIRDITVEDLRGVDAVFHLAALSNDPLGDLNPNLTYDINHHASVRLAELSKQAGVERYIFSSSCSNYGAAGDDFMTESGELNPVTAYGESKVRTEADVRKLADDSFSPVFLRNATAYGVSPRLRFDIVVNNLVAWAFTTGMVYMKSDGTAWRPMIHIRDISQAFLVVAKAPRERIHNEVFNVGSITENYTVRQMAQIVADTVPGSKFEFASDGIGADKRNYRVDFSKIAKTLPEFKPQWTVRRGAQELHEAYQRVGLVQDDFEGIRYKRIAQIKDLLASGDLDANLRGTTRESVPPTPVTEPAAD